MNRNVTCVTPWCSGVNGIAPEKIIFDYLCCFRIILVRGELRDHVFNSTTTTVFSDLDGTLLDSHSYDWQPVPPGSAVYAKRMFPSFSVAVNFSGNAVLAKNVGATRVTTDAENGAVIQLAEQWQDIDGFHASSQVLAMAKSARF